jgi:hypothetical protein
LKKSEDLYQSAQKLLYQEGLHDLLKKHGKVLYAGSYALDLMVWKDIDLNIIVGARDCKDVLKFLVSNLLDRKDVTRVKVFRDLREKYGTALPRGVYVGAIVDGWKLDIFLVDEQEAAETREKTESVRKLLTKEKREQILLYKNKLLTPSGRSPKFSSVHVYDAILKEGLTEQGAVYKYLRENGIRV